MPFRGIEEYLHDIVENIDAARSFVRGRTLEQFKKDRLRHYAVLRALEIVSEATRHLTPELKARYPDIDWRAIADAGNVYRHVYHDVDLNRVWAVATAMVDPLYDAARGELARLAR